MMSEETGLTVFIRSSGHGTASLLFGIICETKLGNTSFHLKISKALKGARMMVIAYGILDMFYWLGIINFNDSSSTAVK